MNTFDWKDQMKIDDEIQRQIEINEIEAFTDYLDSLNYYQYFLNAFGSFNKS
jgi:hypothetical protein